MHGLRFYPLCCTQVSARAQPNVARRRREVVLLAAQGAAPTTAQPDIDDEHAYGGNGFGTQCPDDIPF